jgi:hypothetical protein
LLDLEGVPGGDRLLGNGASIPIELIGTQYTDTSTTETPEDTPTETPEESMEENPEENNEGGG